MKFLNDLFFDRKLVKAIKQSNVDANFLYNQLNAGKITLHEYLAALHN